MCIRDRLKLENLKKVYDGVTILENINLNIEDGEIISILGPSGCGKTTLLNLILGIAEADGGHIVFNGQDITDVSYTHLDVYKRQDLGGILCNNMSNPVGACQAVKDAGKSGDIVIGGMDHDLRTLEYLKDGTLFVAQVQNCYDMGYKLVYNAVKTIDGEAVEEEATNVGSTSVYADSADKYLSLIHI